METKSFDSDWNLGDQKFRDGRYGPIFSGLIESIAKLVTVEIIEQDDDSQKTQDLLAQLNKRPTASEEPHPYIVTFLGFQQKPEGFCLLWEYEGGGTLQEFINQHGALDSDVVEIYLAHLVTGLKALQERGYSTAFINSANIMLGPKLTAKIEPPILGVTGTRRAVPPGVLTVPELELDSPISENMPNPDVWLLGVVAAEALTGNSLTEASARQIKAQLEEGIGNGSESAWELFIPHDVSEKLAAPVADFLRQCFIV